MGQSRRFGYDIMNFQAYCSLSQFFRKVPGRKAWYGAASRQAITSHLRTFGFQLDNPVRSADTMDTPTELTHEAGKDVPALIASIPASAQQRRVAFGVVILLSVVFAIVLPFAPIGIARLDVFIPVVQSVIFVADLITAILLFAQYSIQPQKALLALASGYIFSGMFAFLQTLDFPGAYSATGLLGGGLSGAAWLFSFWHILFPLAVITYVLLKDGNETANQLVKPDPGRAIAITVACVLGNRSSRCNGCRVRRKR